jgi:CheY-like chemotaxis protein
MSYGPILIIDDSPANLKFGRVVLTAAGYEVHTAEDAEQALALLATLRPRLILMDLQLPGMDGLALTRRLKSDAATRDVIIVTMTAYATKGDEQKAREAGSAGYITRPYDARTLTATGVGFLDG